MLNQGKKLLALLILSLFSSSHAVVISDYLPNKEIEEFRLGYLNKCDIDEYYNTVEEKEISPQYLIFNPQETLTEWIGRVNSNIKIVPCQLNEEEMLCHHYSFYKTTERYGTFASSFTKSNFITESYAFLEENYNPVVEPKDGDIVAYFNENAMIKKRYRNDKDIKIYKGFIHTGIYRGNDIVESKWGKIKFIYFHHLFCTPPAYGEEVLFYRLKNHV